MFDLQFFAKKRRFSGGGPHPEIFDFFSKNRIKVFHGRPSVFLQFIEFFFSII